MSAGGSVSDTGLSDVSRYYDLLHLWTRYNKGFRRFSGSELHAVHRWLIDPDTGEFSPATIHNIILSSGAVGLPRMAIDAGCGYGGTMFALHAKVGGDWHGLTVSRRQRAVGMKLAAERGLGSRITFARESFDVPQARACDFIVGIESLNHSADPARTIANLSRALMPGGHIVIVDDMPEEKALPAFARDLEDFKKFWRFPAMPSAQRWSAVLAAAGCETVEMRDLSDLMRPRSEREISRALDEVHARRHWRDRIGLRRIGEAEIGGLLLERLGRERIVRYTMIVARKRDGAGYPPRRLSMTTS